MTARSEAMSSENWTPPDAECYRLYHRGVRDSSTRAAAAKYQRLLRSGGITPKPRGKLMHGTKSNYNKGCRCTACTVAAVEYTRKWRDKRKETL